MGRDDRVGGGVGVVVAKGRLNRVGWRGVWHWRVGCRCRIVAQVGVCVCVCDA